MPRLILLAVIAVVIGVRALAIRRLAADHPLRPAVVLGSTLLAVVLGLVLCGWVALAGPLVGGVGIVIVLGAGGAWLRTTLDVLAADRPGGPARRPGPLEARLARMSSTASIVLLLTGFCGVILVLAWAMGRAVF
jgi:hypothetical protein